MLTDMDARAPLAPGELEAVRRFVNTLDIEDATDVIATRGSLCDWLRNHSLCDPGAGTTDADVDRARELREALRTALAANHDRAPIPPDARAVLNAVADRAELSLTLDQQGRWQPHPRAGGIEGALGKLVAVVVDAMTAGDWQRLKVCANDACRWAFYDHSRARTGRWCSMQICGNRTKQRTWRSRHE